MQKTHLQVAKSLFPRYKGRTVREDTRDIVSLYNRYWDGGSFRQYALMRKDGTILRFPDINPFTGPHNETYKLNDGEIMYVHCYSGVRQYIQVISSA